MRTKQIAILLALFGLLLGQNAHAFYNPTKGTWLSRDPIGVQGGANVYVLARNTLINSFDLNGLMPPDIAFDPPIESPPPEAAEARRKRLIEMFKAWYDKAKKDMAWIDKLPPCPCNIMKAVSCNYTYGYGAMSGTITSYEPENFDHDVWYRSHSFWWVQTFYFDYHPGAGYELRTKDSKQYGGAGQQCNYDANGNLITHGPGAGTADRSGPGGNHVEEDVNPFDWAYELDGNQYTGTYTDMYREVRPPDKKNNCPKNP